MSDQSLDSPNSRNVRHVFGVDFSDYVHKGSSLSLQELTRPDAHYTLIERTEVKLLNVSSTKADFNTPGRLISAIHVVGSIPGSFLPWRRKYFDTYVYLNPKTFNDDTLGVTIDQKLDSFTGLIQRR